VREPPATFSFLLRTVARFFRRETMACAILCFQGSSPARNRDDCNIADHLETVDTYGLIPPPGSISASWSFKRMVTGYVHPASRINR